MAQNGFRMRKRRQALRVVPPALLLFVFSACPLPAGGGVEPECVFVRGNVNPINETTVVDLNDAVEILAFLFLGVSVPECIDVADVNDNGLVEISDYTYLVNFLFNGGPPPPPPFPDPGTDPTPGVSVGDERDPRFEITIGRAAGIPGMTGIEVPVRITNEEPIRGLQVVFRYNTRDPDCPDLLIHEIRVEENTLLSQESAEYIIAEFHNREGIAYIAALKDFATPFWFQVGEDPDLPAGENQLLATIVLGIASCADMGFAPIEITDGVVIPNDFEPPPGPLPEVHTFVLAGDSIVRPVVGTAEAGVDVRRGFIRGDANKDDGVDIADAVFLLDYIFRAGTVPPCMDAADANNDTRVDISDPIFLLNYLFRGGPQPSEPFPQAGVDPSDDGRGSLGCESDRP